MYTVASVSDLLLQFLEFRRAHGSQVEKRLYQNMTTSQLVTRLLKNRPVVFMDADDQYELHTGQTGRGLRVLVRVLSSTMAWLVGKSSCLFCTAHTRNTPQDPTIS